MSVTSFWCITFGILFLSIYLHQIHGLEWFGDWSLNCDFPGNDLWSEKCRFDDCLVICASRPGCTHYVWTSSDEICWLKGGSVKRSDAVEKPSLNGRCGLLIGEGFDGQENNCPPGTEGTSCDGNMFTVVDLEKFKCVFEGFDAALIEQYYQQFQSATWKPKTESEAVVYLNYVSLVTGGLRKLETYCQPTPVWEGNAAWNHDAIDRKRIYYGKEWFQMAWPCYGTTKSELSSENNTAEIDHVLDKRASTSAKDTVGATARRSLLKMSKDSHQRDNRGLFSREHDPISRQIESYKKISQCFKLGQTFE